MLLGFRILFAVLTLLFAGYGFITKNYDYQLYMILFMGLMILTMGLQEFKQKRKGYGWLMVGVFLFSIAVVLSDVFMT